MTGDSHRARRRIPTVIECERLFYAFLYEGDAEGINAALLVMALQDPRRADQLLTSLLQALNIEATWDGR